MRRNHRQRLSHFQAGLIALVLIAVGTYFGFAKSVPFRDHYEIGAVFRTANNVKPGSFVRIAGVNVGKVVGVERVEDDPEAARVVMRLDDRGLPIHKDATVAIRPRIFLEGNFFVDLQPGSPSSPVIDDGDTIPVNQTSSPVQLDQVLTSLQAPTREQLQSLLDELSTGVDGQGGAGFNRSIRHWLPAYRDGAIVADAQLGEEEHDLTNYLRSAGEVASALNRDPAQLAALITDFNTAANAFASEQRALGEAVAELPRTLRTGLPALAALNDAFPHVRRLVADLRPATRSSGPALDAGLPLVEELRDLLGPRELGGLVAELRPTVPRLTRLSRRTPALFEQVRAASSCQNEQILPWTKDTIEDPVFPAVGPVYVESTKPLSGLAGESRSGDANGQWFRVMLNGGALAYPLGTNLVLQSASPLLGVNPPPPAELKRPFRPDVPCETQEPPDLRTIPGSLPAPRRITPDDPAAYRKLVDAAVAEVQANTPDDVPAADRRIIDAAIDALKGLAE